MNSSPSLLFPFYFLSSFLFFFVPTHGTGSIVFSTLGRSLYGFDIFSTPIPPSSSQTEIQLTDGVSVNYNGFFPSSPFSLLSLLNPSSSSSNANHIDALIYVTERHGYSTVYLDLLSSSSSPSNRRETLELPTRLHFPMLPTLDGQPSISVKDRPSLSGDRLIFVSTHEPSHSPRQSWAAVYSTHLPTGATTRLTPDDIADFSPAVSPSGKWTAVASSGERGWTGEVQELNSDIYVFKTIDGSARTLVVSHGGWPCWADDSTIYFHRQSSDGWWSVYRAAINIQKDVPDLISLDRITPPGFHAFTPAVSAAVPELIAVATRRASSQFRHIELIDLREGRNAYAEVTRLTTPYTHHYNPFFSPDAGRIGYHRCRGNRNSGNPPLILENINSISPETFSLLRLDGYFPSFSPDGHRIAYVKLPGVYVVNSDGSNPIEIYGGNAFGTAWDWRRKGVIYTSRGPDFATESTEVDIISITLSENDDEAEPPLIKKLTLGGKNNAFPSPSPDGKWVVFRSGRSGYKNLYVMDSIEGESGGIYQLTDGPWSDTMCNWSPDGEWIAFASDRDNPGSESFSIYMVHPNGTGLRVVHSGNGGRTNHPWFSPDSASLVFTSDYAGLSSEPISNPHQFQPYGEIFTMKIDGSDIRRLTHDSNEDGTPTWIPFFLKPSDVAESLQGVAFCGFDDCYWLSVKNQINGVRNGTNC